VGAPNDGTLADLFLAASLNAPGGAVNTLAQLSSGEAILSPVM